MNQENNIFDFTQVEEILKQFMKIVETSKHLMSKGDREEVLSMLGKCKQSIFKITTLIESIENKLKED